MTWKYKKRRGVNNAVSFVCVICPPRHFLTDSTYLFNYQSSRFRMGLKHSKEVREALPKVEANGTSKKTDKCDCSPCNCNPCKCPEKRIATNGGATTVTETEVKPCQEPAEGGDSQVDERSQCHDGPEVNADDATQDPPSQPIPKADEQPTLDSKVKPIEEETTSPVVEENNESTTGTQAGTEVGSVEQ